MRTKIVLSILFSYSYYFRLDSSRVRRTSTSRTTTTNWYLYMDMANNDIGQLLAQVKYIQGSRATILSDIKSNLINTKIHGRIIYLTSTKRSLKIVLSTPFLLKTQTTSQINSKN